MKKTFSEERIVLIKRVLKKYDTPCYIYFYENILRNIQRFKSLFSFPIRIFFPMMTNDNPNIIKILHKQGLEVFVNSISHLEIALEAGVPPKAITFTSSNCDSLVFDVLKNIPVQFNANSVYQLKTYLNKSQIKSVGARVNIYSLLKMFGKERKYFEKAISASRIGLTIDELQKLLDNNDSKSAIKGLHIYPGTKLYDAKFLIDCYECLIQFGLQYRQLKYLNFGGGFPIHMDDEMSSFDWIFFAKEVNRLQKIIQNQTSIEEIQFEPGRNIIGNAAIFGTKITDLYEHEEIFYIGTDASINIFPRPFYYKDEAYLDHPITLLRNNSEEKNNKLKSYVICGESTYSADILSPLAMLNNPAIGDFLIFENAGAYCTSMRNSFLGSTEPLEIVVKGNSFKKMRGESKKVIAKRFLNMKIENGDEHEH